MKPVEIEFLMKDNLSGGLDKAGQSASSMEDAFKQAGLGIDELKSKIETLKSQQKQLQNLINDSSKWGKPPKALTDEYDKISQEIAEAEQRIAKYSGQINNAEKVHTSLRTQIKSVKDEMAALRNEAQQNNQTIDENTGKYAELRSELGRLTQIQKDVAQQANVLSNHEMQFQGIIQGVSGLAGGFSAATGAMSLFAGENENLQKIMTKLQSVMAITIGLQQVAQTLNKDSAFMLVTVRKAKELLTAAETKFAISLGISNVAAKALMATLTLGLSVAIGTMIYLWDKFSTKAQEAKKAAEEFNKSVSEIASKPISSIKELSIAWSKLGDDIRAKEKFIDDNKSKFESLGASVNSVVDAENLLIANKDAFISSQILKAKALASTELASDKYKIALEKQLKTEVPDKYVGTGNLRNKKFDTGSLIQQFGRSKSADDLLKQGLIELNPQWEKYQQTMKDNFAEANKLFEQAANFTTQEQEILARIGQSSNNIVEGSVSELKKAISKLQKEQEKATTKVEYADLQRKIDINQKLIDKITGGKSTTGQSDKANQLKTEQAARKRQIEEYTANLVNQQRQSEFDIRQARINEMKDGIDKEKATIALNYDKLIEENRLRQEKWIKDLQAKKNLEFENEHPDWKKKGMELPTVTANDLTKEQRDQLDKYTKSANEYQTAATAKLVKDLADKYRDYAQQRIDIEKKFNADLAAMYDENENLINGITQNTVDELKQQMTEALATLDNEFSHKKTSIENLFDDMSQKSVSDMRLIAKEAQEMMNFIKGGEWDSGKAERFGIKTQAQFKQLNAEWSKSPEKLEAIQKAIRKLNDEANRSETAFNKMAAGLKKVFSAKGQSDLEEGLSMLSDGLRSVTEMSDLFCDSLHNIGELSGSEMFTQLADGISSVMDAANKTMQGAQAGAAFGPIGAAVGAALGLVSSITGALAAGKAQAEKNAKLTAEMMRNQYTAEKEVNRLYRERYDWSQRIGESNLEYAQRVGEELKRQRAETEQDADDYWKKLQDSTYKDRWDNGKRYGAFGIDELAKDVDAGYVGNASLRGKTEKEIEELYQKGQLSDDAAAWYKLWKDANDEKQQLLKKEEEELERIRELTTGSSYNAVANSIVEGFKAGKRSAADFADTFEELMKQAVLSSLSMKADEKMRKWYEDFAEMGEGGYTQEEIDELRRRYMENMEQLAKDAETLKEISGVDFSSKTQSGKAGAYEAASQESITRLEGLYSSMLEHSISIDDSVENIVEGMSIALGHLRKIEENTSSSDAHLDKIEKAIETMKDDIATIKRDGIRTR